jgi:hypothetical protein
VFDLPWIPPRKTVCDPASRSWLTSSGVAFHRTAPSCEEPVRSTRLRGPKARWSFDLSGPASGTEVPRSQNRPVFRGPSWVDHSRVPLRSPSIRRPSGAASRWRKIDSSGASSRLARDEPGGSSHSRRRRSDLWSPAAPSCRFWLLGRPGPPSRSREAQCTRLPSRGSGKCGVDPVENVDIGNNWRNLFKSSLQPRFGCRSVPLRLLRPSA